MNEKYPDHGTEDNDQEIYAERTGARVPPDGGVRPPADGLSGASDLPPARDLAAGDDRVDAAVAGLSRLRGLPVDEHVAVLEEAHGRLRDILGELDEGAERPDLAKGRP
jgi:hypothetical protein